MITIYITKNKITQIPNSNMILVFSLSTSHSMVVPSDTSYGVYVSELIIYDTAISHNCGLTESIL